MEYKVKNHILSQIQKAPILTEPYPHFYVENVFPEDYYQKILSYLPEHHFYKSLSETNKVSKGAFKERFVLSLQNTETLSPFWHEFSAFFHSQDWISFLLEKFAEPLHERFGFLSEALKISTIAELVQDHSNYAIGPHTDLPHRLCTLLFYFPKTKDQTHLGTSIYRPRDPTWTCEGNNHYRFEDFVLEKTMPYLPNSLFGFFKSDRSFHGVEPILEENVERNLMNHYLKWTV